MNIDNVDRKILDILQKNARISNVELARRLDFAPSGILERVRKLERRGLIKNYEARLAAEKLDFGLIAFISIRTDEPVGVLDAAIEMAKIPEVQEVHHLAGEDCYLLKVRVCDNAALATLMREKLGRITSITNTKTTIVLETVKETLQLPLNYD